ncbi:MAG: helix-turn-helix transcriptional regulator [Micropepsaceae bacterium]
MTRQHDPVSMSPHLPPLLDASILEILTRGGAVGAFIGIGIVIARPPFTPVRVTGLLFCLAAAGHTLTQHPAIREALGAVLPLAWAFSVMGVGLFWAFATELFGDRPRLEPARFAPAVLLLALGGAAFAGGRFHDAFLLAHNLVSAGLIIHVLIMIWSSWRNDLVESRRRLRGPILAAGGIYAVAVISVQIAEIFVGSANALSPLAAAVLLLLGLSSLGAFLQADPELFAAPSKIEPVDAPASGVRTFSVEDTKTAERLDRQMRSERIYRDENLSIGALALKLGVPEYRLRRLINQHLGHRNFNAYLNGWRLADAKQALADPAQREVPISTIALDAGFQSLGPFNRAFKAETGLTPSEFRIAQPPSAGQAKA